MALHYRLARRDGFTRQAFAEAVLHCFRSNLVELHLYEPPFAPHEFARRVRRASVFRLCLALDPDLTHHLTGFGWRARGVGLETADPRVWRERLAGAVPWPAAAFAGRRARVCGGTAVVVFLTVVRVAVALLSAFSAVLRALRSAESIASSSVTRSAVKAFVA